MRIRSSRRALDDAKHFAVMFKGLVDVLQDLGEIESIEQMLDNAEKRKRALTSDVASAESTLAGLKQQHEDAKIATAQHVEIKKKEAGAVVEDGRRNADAIISDARSEADRIMQSGKDSAAAAVAAVQRTLNQINAEIEDRKGKFDQISGNLASITERLAAAQKELDDIERQKAALRAKLG